MWLMLPGVAASCNPLCLSDAQLCWRPLTPLSDMRLTWPMPWRSPMCSTLRPMLASSGSAACIVASEPPHCRGCRQAGQAGEGERSGRIW